MRPLVSIGDFRELQRRIAWSIWAQRWFYERKCRKQLVQQNAPGATSSRSRAPSVSLAMMPNTALFEIKTLAEEMISAEAYLVVREFNDLDRGRSAATTKPDDSTAGSSSLIPIPMQEFDRQRIHSINASLHEVLWRAAAPFMSQAATVAQARDIMDLMETCADFIMKEDHRAAIERMYAENFPTYTWNTLPVSIQIAVEQLYFAGVILAVTFETMHNLFWTSCAQRFKELNTLAGINASERLKLVYTECLATFNERYKEFIITRSSPTPVGTAKADDSGRTSARNKLTDPLLHTPEMFGIVEPPSAERRHSAFDPSAKSAAVGSPRSDSEPSPDRLADGDGDSDSSSKKKDKKNKNKKDKDKNKDSSNETNKTLSSSMRETSGNLLNRLSVALSSSPNNSGSPSPPTVRTGRSNSVTTLSLLKASSEGELSATLPKDASSESSSSSNPLRRSSGSRERSDRGSAPSVPLGVSSDARHIGPIYSPRCTSASGPMLYEAQVAMHLLSIFAKFCWDSYYTVPVAGTLSNTLRLGGSASVSKLTLESLRCRLDEGIGPLIRQFDIVHTLQQIPCYVVTPVNVASYIWQLSPEMRESSMIQGALHGVHVAKSEVLSFEPEFSTTLKICTPIARGNNQSPLYKIRDVFAAYRICGLIVIIAHINQRYSTLQTQILVSGQGTLGNQPLELLQRCAREFQELHTNMLTYINPKRRAQSSPSSNAAGIATSATPTMRSSTSLGASSSVDNV